MNKWKTFKDLGKGTEEQESENKSLGSDTEQNTKCDEGEYSSWEILAKVKGIRRTNR